jgi:alpha-beta hydrolase superfamily lysophospholipase
MTHQTQPVAFSGLAAFLTMPTHHELRDTCVLFASAFGYEDLCSRKMQRIVAEQLASRGLASMRFDYMGTGDALDVDDQSTGPNWVDDLQRAANQLKASTGAKRLILVAQGIGSLIAAQAMKQGLQIDGIAYLAPVTSGKSYLRELSMWSTLIDDGLGLRKADRITQPGSIGGLVMPEAVVHWLAGANLLELTPQPSAPSFVAFRADRAAEKRFADGLAQSGTDVSAIAFEGYDALMLSPTQSIVPQTICDDLVKWIDAQAGADLVQKSTEHIGISGAHEAAEFTESLISFGPNQHLIGVETRPNAGACTAAVVLNGSGYDRRSGWGRQVTWLARELAKQGIASLRYDAANVADSAPSESAPAAVLYHTSQLDDARAAVDYLTGQHTVPVMMSGRCSGAYLALKAAEQDPRISAVLAANPVVFYWQEGRSLDEALDMRPRTLGEYGGRVFSLAIFGRLLRGEVNISAALRNLTKSFMSRYHARSARLRKSSSEDGKSVFKMFDQLKQRNIPTQLLFSENDAGIDNLKQYFETVAHARRRYTNLAIDIVYNADHNLSSEASRGVYLEHLLHMVRSAQKAKR